MFIYSGSCLAIHVPGKLIHYQLMICFLLNRVFQLGFIEFVLTQDVNNANSHY